MIECQICHWVGGNEGLVVTTMTVKETMEALEPGADLSDYTYCPQCGGKKCFSEVNENGDKTMTDRKEDVYGITLTPWSLKLQRALTPAVLSAILEELPRQRPGLAMLVLIATLPRNWEKLSDFDKAIVKRGMLFVEMEAENTDEGLQTHAKLIDIVLDYKMLETKKITLRQRWQRFIEWFWW